MLIPDFGSPGSGKPKNSLTMFNLFYPHSCLDLLSVVKDKNVEMVKRTDNSTFILALILADISKKIFTSSASKQLQIFYLQRIFGHHWLAQLNGSLHMIPASI